MKRSDMYVCLRSLTQICTSTIYHPLAHVPNALAHVPNGQKALVASQTQNMD
ncbi:hypothetical protein N9933_02060 [bacterium]|nr:hypothetical protein [bacterium]